MAKHIVHLHLVIHFIYVKVINLVLFIALKKKKNKK